MRRRFVPLAAATLTPLTALAPVASAAAAPAQTPAGASHTSAARVLDVAHRGASAYAPENTLAAFREAETRGADLFELDVQQTKDGKLVIVHDTTLARTTNAETVYPSLKPWRIRDLTLSQIRRLDAGSWFGTKFRGQRVPTLDETLQTMRDSGLDLLLEVKSPELYPGIGKRVAAELRTEPSWLAADRIIVQSFDFDFTRGFDDLMPTMPIGLLGTPSTGGLSAAAKYADYINPPHGDVTAGYVRSVHGRGLRLLAWTVDDTSTMRRVIAAGADGVITNRPDTLRSVIGPRSGG